MRADDPAEEYAKRIVVSVEGMAGGWQNKLVDVHDYGTDMEEANNVELEMWSSVECGKAQRSDLLWIVEEAFRAGMAHADKLRAAVPAPGGHDGAGKDRVDGTLHRSGHEGKD